MVSSLTSSLYGYAGPKKTEEAQMAKRINRAIELLEADQALYYDGPHTGHALGELKHLVVLAQHVANHPLHAARLGVVQDMASAISPQLSSTTPTMSWARRCSPMKRPETSATRSGPSPRAIG